MSLMMCYMKRLNIISDIVLAEDVEQILVWGWVAGEQGYDMV